MLSRREAEVAGLVALGLTNRDIAKKLFLSERTVEGHVGQILNKLGFSTRSQIAAWYVEQRSAGSGPTPVEVEPLPTPTQSPRAPRLARRWGLYGVMLVILIIAGGAFAGALVVQRPLSPEPARVRVIASGIVNARFIVPCIAVNSRGTLYLSDGAQVHTINTAGAVIDLAPPRPLVVGIAFDSADTLYVSLGVTDVEGPLIFRYQGGSLEPIAAQATATLRSSNSPVSVPGCLATDSEGSLYMSSLRNVYKISPDGRMETYAGSSFQGYSGDGGPATNAGLDRPLGIAIDNSGNLYIADTLNNRVRRVDHLSGIITTVAGSGRPGGSGDGGQATDAKLNGPIAVAFDPSGNLYISDSDNHRIRKVDRTGRISTVVGSGKYGSAVEGRLLRDIEMTRTGGIAFDRKGNLFIVDSDNNRVLKVRLD
ncbi:MAG: hypothetical protein NVS9B11_17010 [Candidatus Dormibacteraceae bacterium]